MTEFGELLLPDGGGLLLKFEQATASEHNVLCSSANKDVFNNSCATGMRVYDGGKLLGALLLSSPIAKRIVANAAVVELGCGCGVSGLAAAVAGAKTVTFTDLEPQCLKRAESNLAMNAEAVAKSNSAFAGAEFHQLKWEPDCVRDFKSTRQTGFDLVLAAELLYFRVDAAALVATIGSLLNRERGVCLMSHVNRLNGGREALPKVLAEQGLAFRYLSLPMTLSAPGCCTDPEVLEQAKWLTHRLDFVAVAHSMETIDALFPEALRFVAAEPKNDDDEEMPGDGLFD